MRVSAALVNGLWRREAEASGLLLAQRDTAAKQAEFHRITANCTAGQRDFSALDQAEHHQPLNLRIGRINGRDNAFLASFQCIKCHAIIIHLCAAFLANSLFFSGFPNCD